MSGEVRKIAASMPAVLVQSSEARFCVLPGLIVPMFSFPRLARAAAMMSSIDRSGDQARVTNKILKKATVETEVKSVRTL